MTWKLVRRDGATRQWHEIKDCVDEVEARHEAELHMRENARLLQLVNDAIYIQRPDGTRYRVMLAF